MMGVRSSLWNPKIRTRTALPGSVGDGRCRFEMGNMKRTVEPLMPQKAHEKHKEDYRYPRLNDGKRRNRQNGGDFKPVCLSIEPPTPEAQTANFF